MSGSIRAFGKRFEGLFNKERKDRDLNAELESHMQMYVDDQVRSGMSPDEARRAAAVRFGNIEAVKEQYRDRRTLPWLEHFLQDVRFGVRMLLKNPGFSFAAVLALTLGIGANTALFSMVYGVLLRPLPYNDGTRLVSLQQPATLAGITNSGFSPKELADYRARVKTMDQIEEYHGMAFILLGPKPDRVQTGVVSSGFFQMLGVKPLMGRTFTPADDEIGAPAVLMLSNSYWKTMFGGDPNVIGKTVRMNDRVHTIVGVLPPIPQYPRENDVYMPISACPFRSSQQLRENRQGRLMNVFGHVKPGVSIASASGEVRTIAESFRSQYPKDYDAADGFTGNAVSLQEQLTERARPMLLLLLGATGLVLLICCTNVANLALARTVRREREFAIRAALGASRGRLARQLLTESILLSLVGGALGLLLAAGSMDLLITFVGRFTTRAAGITLSAPVLLFTLGISVLTGLAFGLLPALSVRGAIANAIKTAGGSTTGGSRSHAMRNGLIVAQIALSFVMLSAAGLLLRSLLKLQRVDAGFSADHVLTAKIPYNWSKLTDNDKAYAHVSAILRELQVLPGVSAVGLTSGVPLDNTRPAASFRNGITIEGQPPIAGQARPSVNSVIASPGAFTAVGIPLVSGRIFGDQDGKDTLPVVLVSLGTARHYWPNQDPLGKRISGDNGQHWSTIVGIVGDVRQFGLDQAPQDTVYLPLVQQPFANGITLRSSGDPRNMVKMVQNAVAKVDPEQPLVDIKTLDELRGESLVASRVTAVLLGLFASIALAIAATGLAGVTAFLVSQRTREIGIRIALGAQVRQVLTLIMSHGVRLIAVGAALGLTFSFVTGRALQKLLFEVRSADTATLIGVGATLVAVSLLASYIPARRATKVDPMIALRCE